ncbi:TonB-dependent receptor [Pseudoblastomonas flavescens]|uniref:TonB-dependent receptor n=1 Tax=Alteriqipengyuania flavescens TaxID=3053610 RepID=UPI0025B6280A|nr:TonB-dependent receptor [Alteriqipengyuania flavescens]WJY19129.1 TonB-dependent receptor [Alteriqipengyuania flavescens]
MQNTTFRKGLLASSSALKALALVGAGVAASTGAIAPAAAQDYTSGAIAGTVTDETGAPVAGATVVATSNATGQTRTATTGSNGTFRLNALPTGSYDIVVTGGGFQDFTATGVNVLASQAVGVDISVSSANVITVIGTTIVRDFEGTTQGLNVDVEELTKRVPLPRDLTSVVLLAPGTTQGDSAFGNLASIGGSSVAENAYYVNGLNTTNFDNYLGSARVPFDFYRSVEAKTGGYPAEFGRATGGIVNAVTKSGSNDFFGGIHLDWAPKFGRTDGEELITCEYNQGELQALIDDVENNLSPRGTIINPASTCEDLTNRDADEAMSYSAVVEAGGPIIEDRLFVYGLLEFRETESNTVSRASGLSTRNTQDDPFWGVKVDAYPIDSQHFEFTIFDTRRQTVQSTAPYTEGSGDEGFNIGDYQTTGVFNFGGISYVGKYTGTFTDWLTVSAAYGVMEDRFDNAPVGSAATLPYVVNASGVTVNGTPNGGLLNDQRASSISTPYETKREFYRADVDLFFDLLGSHHIRAGFDTEINTLTRGTVRTGGDYLLGNGLQHFEFTIFDTRRQTVQSTAPYTEGSGDEGFNIGDYQTTGVFNFGGISYVGKYTGTFTDWLTVSAAYGVMEDRFDNAPVGSAATLPYVVNASGVTVNGTPNGGLLNDQRASSISTPYETKREFYRADVDLFFDLLGSHHIRAGFDTEINTLTRGTVRTGGDYLLGNGLISQAAYDAGAGGAGIAYVLRPGGIVELNYFNSGGEFESINRAFYIQDEWNVTDRLTLNLGLRRDDFLVKKADGTDFFDLDENYAPRVGFSYDVGDNGRFYGFFGQYFLPVASNTAFRGAGAEFFYRERFEYTGFNSDGVPLFGRADQVTDNGQYQNACPSPLTPFSSGSNCLTTGDGSVPPSVAFVGQNLKATKQSEYIVGYDHDFGGFTVGLAYIHRNLDRTAEDAAIDLAVINYCNENGITGCETVWTGYHQYVTYNVGGPLTVALLGDDTVTSEALDGRVVTFTADELGFGEAIREYDAVELTFERPWDGKWSLTGSYTWSRSYGNSEGYVQSDFGQDDAGITQDFDQPGFVDFATGRLPNDRTHRFKLFGAYAPTEQFVVGTNISVDSPRPLSCFGWHPTDVFAGGYGAASHYCSFQPAPRGEGSETDWLYNVDMSFRYNVDAGQDRQISFTADVFNIFNFQNATSRNEFGDQDAIYRGDNTDDLPDAIVVNPNYDIVTGYQAPRSVRFGIDILF